jgi:hypothetical protein
MHPPTAPVTKAAKVPNTAAADHETAAPSPNAKIYDPTRFKSRAPRDEVIASGYAVGALLER